MSNKLARKMVAMLFAVALVFTSGVGVFAASSSEVGAVGYVSTTGHWGSKTFEISYPAATGAASYNIYVNGAYVGNTTGTTFYYTAANGGQYTISVQPIAKNGTPGSVTSVSAKTDSMRWMKNIKVKKVKKGKKKFTARWKKVKGATGYQIRYSKDGVHWTYKYVKGGKKTSKTIKKLSKGTWYVQVRAVKGDYLGVLSKTYKVKVK